MIDVTFVIIFWVVSSLAIMIGMYFVCRKSIGDLKQEHRVEKRIEKEQLRAILKLTNKTVAWKLLESYAIEESETLSRY